MKPTVKIYLAKRMTGQTGAVLVSEAVHAQAVCPLDVELFDPVLIEGVAATDAVIGAATGDLKKFWARDKQAIRDAHVVFDMTGPAKSEGVAHEIGYARYNLWKPVVRLYPGLGASVARLEDDLIVGSLEEGYALIKKFWGTRTKRILWRLKMLNRCLPKWFYYQLKEWK